MKKRLCFIIGTRAQLIKMAPVIKACEKNKCPVRIIMTGQHRLTMERLLEDFGISTVPVYIYRSREVSGILSMIFWLIKVFWNFTYDWKKYFIDRNCIIVIHGDTVSTLVGALMGKFLKVKVAHVESGLRSYNLFNPFPEELTRLIVFYLIDIAFCPGNWATDNMKKYKCERIDTEMNTIVDSLRMIYDKISFCKSEKYGVFSIHRFENIFLKNRLIEIIEMLEYAAEHCKVIFVLHPSTEKRLKTYGLYDRLNKNPNVEIKKRMIYTKFISLIINSSFVVTDGGSNQEEISLTNIPVYLMRKKTERIEGLGKNIIIGNYDKKLFKFFISSALAEMAERSLNIPSHSPSNLICEYLSRCIL